jgi:hypothetical protein
MHPPQQQSHDPTLVNSGTNDVTPFSGMNAAIIAASIDKSLRLVVLGAFTRANCTGQPLC